MTIHMPLVPNDPDRALPRVPLPDLDSCGAHFLEWSRPLLTAEQATATESAVAQFLQPGSPARVLHTALAAYDSTDGITSWLDDFWSARYLGRRDRIALNANFFFLFQDNGASALNRAAALIIGALDYKRAYEDGDLASATRQGSPLSSVQSRYLFSSTRIPGASIDTSRNPYSDEWPGPSRARHIAVLSRGRIFRLDVIGSSGQPHSLDELTAALEHIQSITTGEFAGDYGIGRLTTKARAEWAISRQALIDKDPANITALDVIETALFCLCLEDHSPASPHEGADALLHGDSANRWFDKALSLVVFGNGMAGLNGEHCRLDGITVVGFIDAVLGSTPEEQAERTGAHNQGKPAMVPVEFVLDDSLRTDIATAGDAFDEYRSKVRTHTLDLDGFGADVVKALRMSPDAFVQLAFQLAHQRAKGHVGTTYESVAMGLYGHGRTEAMRVVSAESVNFVTTMQDPATDGATRREAFRAAAAVHVARSRLCQAGESPEQLLWELQLLQQRRGIELGADTPMALYQSPGWTIMRDDYLSTSAVPSPNVRLFGFGSTSPQCIGVGYLLLPTSLHVYLSSPASGYSGMKLFAEELSEAIIQLRELLSEGTAASPALKGPDHG